MYLQLYDNLRGVQPDFEDKVHAVHGDVLDNGLGLKENDRKYLEQNIEIVMHSAATVRFDEHLK